MDSISAFLVKQIWPTPSTNRLGERLPSYIDEHIRPALDLKDETVQIEPLDAGEGEIARRWRTRTKGILRVRAWPWEPERRLVQEHQHVKGLFDGLGLRTPQVLLADDSFATMRRWRLEALVEREPDGEVFDPRQPEHAKLIEKFAQELAKLHSQSSVQWGKPWRPKNPIEKPREYWTARLRKFKTRINPETCRMGPAVIERGLEQLKKRAERMELGFPALIHANLHRQSVYAGAEGELIWIGFTTVQYGMPEYDLAQVRVGLMGPEQFAQFAQAYRRAAKMDRDINKDAIMTFSIFLLWEQLNANIKTQLGLMNKNPDASAAAKLKQLQADQRPIEEMISRAALAEK
jgi:hypothetical protein